jgi:hypothetical protein
VGKILGRDRARPVGVCYAALVTGTGHTVAAVAAVNAAGDVIDEDGSVLAGPRGEEEGEVLRGAELIGYGGAAAVPGAGGNSTPVCVCTDAPWTSGVSMRRAPPRPGWAGGGSVFTCGRRHVFAWLRAGRSRIRSPPFQTALRGDGDAAAVRDAVRQTA